MWRYGYEWIFENKVFSYIPHQECIYTESCCWKLEETKCLVPVADMLVDSTTMNETLSLLYGYYGYNQIYITELDISETTFWCPSALCTYEYALMSFGLKNACATYQRDMNLIFHDLIGDYMQVYIDDIVVKSKVKRNHLNHLRTSFKRMKKHGLKINPIKCAFGVFVGEFLGFVIHQKDIKIDKNKAKVIIGTSPPKNKNNFNLC